MPPKLGLLDINPCFTKMRMLVIKWSLFYVQVGSCFENDLRRFSNSAVCICSSVRFIVYWFISLQTKFEEYIGITSWLAGLKHFCEILPHFWRDYNETSYTWPKSHAEQCALYISIFHVAHFLLGRVMCPWTCISIDVYGALNDQRSVSGAPVFKGNGWQLFLYDHCVDLPAHWLYTGHKIALLF